MKTKEKIIRAALKLFNENGIRNVTTRHVAAEVGISHGNLTYHYPSKRALFETIYAEMNKAMEGIQQAKGATGLRYLHILLLYFFRFQERYKFFYTDAVEVARLFPDIAEEHSDAQLKRMKESKALITYYVHIGLMEKEKAKGVYEQLVHSVWFISTFWRNQLGIIPTDHPAQKVDYTLKLIWNLILPHLTEKGLRQYEELIKVKSPDRTADPITAQSTNVGFA